jgi:DNA-directed RNA polymerase specialized sigma24 family protein
LTNDWSDSDFGYETPVELESSFWDDHEKHDHILNQLFKDVEEERGNLFKQIYLNQEPVQEVAKKLNIPPNTLSKRNTRMLEDLRSKARHLKSFF